MSACRWRADSWLETVMVQIWAERFIRHSTEGETFVAATH